eukprot:CAMPEP_0206478134 /NCGR_PEP_ID=MMETSP0324_2-20121206/35852_1 /ASSEMBLY_ACC=CAM_ASM_000836 /TAXON_ID=2866 /ORGANISM="Crypthecodinium cohnii, Strain Seligo" /LENGTH=153 /DNA_ID=CAMNT_0053954341 /DNA_START=17 /DNA_END=475 /DNA_ORIENTATION=+
MPPIRFKAPLPVRFKVPKGNIVPLAKNAPDLPLGKSLILARPHRISAEQIEHARKTLRRHMGRKGDFLINIHATYAKTKKPEGVKMGQGKGNIDSFVARVPAGRAMFHVPSLNPIQGYSPNYTAFREIAGNLPTSSRFRCQNNQFPGNLSAPK